MPLNILALLLSRQIRDESPGGVACERVPARAPKFIVGCVPTSPLFLVWLERETVRVEWRTALVSDPARHAFYKPIA